MRFAVRQSLIGLLFLAVAVAVTWPLAAHVGTQVIGPFRGDNLEYVWKIWWVKHALWDLGRSPLIQPDIYYPFGYRLVYGEITPIHTYMGIPLTVLFGPVATYNLFVLASVALSGYFTWAFVYELTGSVPAGIVAGLAFALCPYRMARIAGHLPLVDTQWIPLLFLFLERFIRSHRLHNAALAGVFCAATALSSWYYGLSLALLFPVYLMVRVSGTWRESSRWVWLQGGAAFGLACGMLVLPFLLPYFGVLRAGESVVPLEQAAFWSASVTDYLTPNPRHFLWGEWVQHHLVAFPGGMPYEFLLGWGFSTTVLAWYGWRRGRTIVGPGWGWWILVALVLSLGPVFKLFGRIVELPVPPGVSQVVNGALDWLSRHSLAGEPYAFARSGRVAIPLPALVLRWLVPGLTGMRGWGRFAIFATFGVVVLAGAGLASLLKQSRVGSATVFDARRSAWLVGTSAAVIFEFYTGPQALITPGPRPVDLWLADLDECVTIIQMPLAVGLSGPQMFYTMYHGQRTATGYGTYLPVLFEERYPELQAFPSDAALDVLTRWEGGGVALVLLDEGDVPAHDPLWHDVERQDRLELMVVVDHVRVYRLR